MRQKLSERGSKQIAIRVAVPVYEKIELVAEKYGLNVSMLTRLALAEFIEKNPLSK